MKQSHIVWLLVGFLCFGFLYLSWGIFTPFVVSLVISYLWSPVISFMEKQWKVPRWLISLWLVLVTVGILLSIIIVLLPLIYNQVLDFIELAPHYKKFIDQKIIPVIVEKFGTIAPDYTAHIKVSTAELFGSSFNSIVVFLKRIWSSGFVVVDLLWFMLLVPFITFHLMKDWNSLLFYVKNAVPIERQRLVQKFFSDANDMISSVIRGQFNVCVIWAIYYTAALSLIGLDHSVLLGITTGLINFIPFVGFIIAFSAALIVAYLQFTSIKYIILVVLVYCSALLFDNGFLSPRLIGKRVGIHSVWSIFAILLGGKLFGFIGMLVAIPVGATIGLLVKMILKYYYKSDLYNTKKSKVKVKINV
jgi:predicted PurR-regulated permease PerM